MSKGKSTTTTTTDPAQMAIYQDLYNKSKSIAQQPFVPYTGAREAGFNPDQLQSFDATRNIFGQSMGFDPRQKLNTLANQSTPTVTPFTGTATQLQPAAMQQGVGLGPAAMQNQATINPVEKFGGSQIGDVNLFGGASINRGDVRDVTPQSLLDTNIGAYQNPFQSQVIDNTLDDLNRARQLQIQSDQDAAIGRGAFGGSRSALLEAETNRNFAEQAGKLASNLRSTGYDRATSLAGEDIDRQFAGDRFMSDIDRQIAMTNAGYGNQFGIANMDAINKARFAQPNLEMQNRIFQQGLLNDQVSNQYRNLNLLGNQGRLAQGLSQDAMNMGYGEFMRGLNYGPQQLGLLSSAVFGMDPNITKTYDQGTAGRIGSAITSLDTLFGSGGIFDT